LGQFHRVLLSRIIHDSVSEEAFRGRMGLKEGQKGASQRSVLPRGHSWEDFLGRETVSG
jgi:hypothetical protein